MWCTKVRAQVNLSHDQPQVVCPSGTCPLSLSLFSFLSSLSHMLAFWVWARNELNQILRLELGLLAPLSSLSFFLGCILVIQIHFGLNLKSTQIPARLPYFHLCLYHEGIEKCAPRAPRISWSYYCFDFSIIITVLSFFFFLDFIGLHHVLPMLSLCTSGVFFINISITISKKPRLWVTLYKRKVWL